MCPMPSFYRHLLNYLQWGAFTNVSIGGTISFPVSFDREHTRTGVKVYSQAAKDGLNKTSAWGRYIAVGN